MPIKIDVVKMPGSSDRYGYVAAFKEVSEYLLDGGNLNRYDPTNPPLDYVRLTINDGDDGEMCITIDGDDGKLSVNMVDDSQWCDCDPTAYIALIQQLSNLYNDLKSGVITLNELINGGMTINETDT